MMMRYDGRWRMGGGAGQRAAAVMIIFCGFQKSEGRPDTATSCGWMDGWPARRDGKEHGSAPARLSRHRALRRRHPNNNNNNNNDVVVSTYLPNCKYYKYVGAQREREVRTSHVALDHTIGRLEKTRPITHLPPLIII